MSNINDMEASAAASVDSNKMYRLSYRAASMNRLTGIRAGDGNMGIQQVQSHFRSG
jgi:hypothetical protein